MTHQVEHTMLIISIVKLHGKDLLICLRESKDDSTMEEFIMLIILIRQPGKPIRDDVLSNYVRENCPLMTLSDLDLFRSAGIHPIRKKYPNGKIVIRLKLEMLLILELISILDQRIQIRQKIIWVHYRKIGKKDIKKDDFILSIIKLELLNGRIQGHKGKYHGKKF